MFRTGGPIGEGVMHGMNGLKNGGTVRYMNGLANGGMPDKRGLVDGPGNYAGLKDKAMSLYSHPYSQRGIAMAEGAGIFEIFKHLMGMKEGGIVNLANGGRTIAGGNQIGTPMGNRTGFADPRKKLLKYVPGFEKVSSATKGIIPKVYQWGKNKLNPYKFPPKMQATTPNAPGVTTATKARDMWHRSGQYFKKHPYLSTLGPAWASQTDPGQAILKTVAQAPVEIAQFGTELFTPKKYEKYLPPNEWWKWKSDVKWKPGDVREEDKVPPPGKTPPGKVIPKVKTQAEIDAAKKIKDEDQLNKIYSLLGVDRAKKNAASKALIDMSRYIDEGGKDVISKKNIGSTISKAISAFDKRLDKVDQLKEAAGLMRAKGIIEKDIRSSDNELKELQKQKIRNDLQKKFSDLKLVSKIPGQKGVNIAASSSSDNYRGNLMTQSDLSETIEKVKKNEGILDETVIIENITNETIKNKNIADGDYTVGDALVTIEQGKVTAVLR